MKSKNTIISTLFIAILVAGFVAYSAYYNKSITNSYGYSISRKEISEAEDDIRAYLSAIGNHDVYNLVKFTFRSESQEQIEFLKDDFKKDFDLIIHNVEMDVDYPIEEFDDDRLRKTYNIKKAMIIRTEFDLDSKEEYGILGMDVGHHVFYMYVVQTDDTNHWRIIDMSTVDPDR